MTESSESGGGPRSFFGELKRRHVFRVVTVYVAVALGVLQIASLTFGPLHLPPSALTVLVVFVLLGLPVAAVLAWAFETTPDGIRPTAAGATGSWRHAGLLLASAVVLTVAAGFGARAWLGASALPFLGPSGPATTSHESAETASALTPAAPGAGSTTSPRSVAVLPFVNMSGDSADEYFSDGITEEILNALAQIRGLEVAGRTSAFAFKGKNESLIKIGKALHVATVMEGSVQRSGGRVRITAQLIDARTGYHLWSHTYTRPLHDVFAIEDDISGAIAGALKLELGADAASRQAGGTEDARAHDLYLRGLAYWNRRTPPDLARAIGYFREAIAQDSEYAQAWGGLALALATPATGGIDSLPPSVALPRSEEAARRALDVDPALPEAHTALGYALMRYDHAWQASRAEFDSAVALDPDYPTARSWLAEWYAVQGRTAEAVESARRAEELDPLSAIIGWTVGRELVFDRRYGEARRQFEKVWTEHPGRRSGANLFSAMQVALLQGDSSAAVDYALRLWRSAPAGQRSDSVRFRRFEDSLRVGGPGWLARRFDPVLAHPARWLAGVKRAADAGSLFDADNVVGLVADPRIDPVRHDPAYRAILRKLGLEPAERRIEQRMGQTGTSAGD